MMKRPLLASLVVLAVVCAAAVTLYAQHSFPVRFDDPEPERLTAAATTSTGVTVTDVLKLTPRDAPPPTGCVESTLGQLYVQTDYKCDFVPFSDTILCMCSDHHLGVGWYSIDGDIVCTHLAGSCV